MNGPKWEFVIQSRHGAEYRFTADPHAPDTWMHYAAHVARPPPGSWGSGGDIALLNRSLALFGLLIAVGESSALGPFIYPFF
jgi:hypothetical protein